MTRIVLTKNVAAFRTISRADGSSAVAARFPVVASTSLDLPRGGGWPRRADPLTGWVAPGRIVLVCPTNDRTIEGMPVRVRRDGPLPIAGQIADQLIVAIRAGTLQAGVRLPPVRVLAGFLRVNRNTVAKVYAALQRQGYVITTRGRGSFVSSVPGGPADDTLAPMADRLIAEAAARGMDETTLRALIAERAGAREHGDHPRVGFVECNPSDLAYFSRQLTARLRVPLVPVLLADLPHVRASLDLVATTLFHVEEVRRLVPRREVIGLMALPEFQTLDAVARLPAHTRAALVCATEEGVRSKERSIRAVGIQRPRLLTATLGQPARLRAVLRRADVVLASPKVLERIQEQLPERVRVIPFGSVLGEGAVALLEERIRAWRPARAGSHRSSGDQTSAARRIRAGRSA